MSQFIAWIGWCFEAWILELATLFVLLVVIAHLYPKWDYRNYKGSIVVIVIWLIYCFWRQGWSLAVG